MSQKIVPNLWYHANAEEAAQLYAGVFPDTEFEVDMRYPNEGLMDFQKPLAGQPLVVSMKVAGARLSLINAGPEIKPNPSISFTLHYHQKFFAEDQRSAREALESAWGELAQGGRILMDLGAYEFSPLYGWVEDRYGISWQLSLIEGQEPDHFLVPCLMFGGEAQNRASEAMEFYQRLFEDSSGGMVVHYPQAVDPVTTTSIMYSEFYLAGQKFSAMDSGVRQDFSFGPGISLEVHCQDQAEIDRLWLALSAHPDEEQCGWLRDGFGVSWQIVPANMDQLMQKPQAFEKLMNMRKIVIADF